MAQRIAPATSNAAEYATLFRPTGSKVSQRLATRIAIESDCQVRADVDGESIGQLPMSVVPLPFRISVAASRSAS